MRRIFECVILAEDESLHSYAVTAEGKDRKVEDDRPGTTFSPSYQCSSKGIGDLSNSIEKNMST